MALTEAVGDERRPHLSDARYIRREASRLRACGAAGSAPAWHAGGQGFESPQVHRTRRAPSSGGARPISARSDSLRGYGERVIAQPRCPSCRHFVYLDALQCHNCDARAGLPPGDAPVLQPAPRADRDRRSDLVHLLEPRMGVQLAGLGGRSGGPLLLVSAHPHPTRTAMTPSRSTSSRRPKRPSAGSSFSWAISGCRSCPGMSEPGGLGFDLLSSISLGHRVSIGHANGIISLDLAESLDDRREALRVRLGEPYRTMLGHLRHEVGHYYQNVLLTDDQTWAECRHLFGDERVSYQDAITRHYKFGAPEGWQDSFISEYATMHPWEDFAETFAHYLHITGTLQTAATIGIHLDSVASRICATRMSIPLDSYRDEPVAQLLNDWEWMSQAFNRINRAMGFGDLYPFVIAPPVRRKLELHARHRHARPADQRRADGPRAAPRDGGLRDHIRARAARDRAVHALRGEPARVARRPRRVRGECTAGRGGGGTRGRLGERRAARGRDACRVAGLPARCRTRQHPHSGPLRARSVGIPARRGGVRPVVSPHSRGGARARRAHLGVGRPSAGCPHRPRRDVHALRPGRARSCVSRVDDPRRRGDAQGLAVGGGGLAAARLLARLRPSAGCPTTRRAAR